MTKYNGEFKIDKHVPIPRITKGTGRPSKYPWDQMEVGDSFFVPGATTRTFTGAAHAQKRYNRRFVCRTVDGGLRIWRTE